MSSPKVTVIIVSYNGKILLEKCLESLFKVYYDNFEIILVDNNSSDETIEFVTKKYPSIIIIKLDFNKGFAEPNNIAAKIAKGDYLIFLNNDTIVTPNFISEMIKVIENDKKIAICQSLLLKPDRSIDSSGDFIDKLGVVYNSKKNVNDIREISSARGASMLIKKELFQDLEGFDELFFVSFEDVDICWRTWIMGYKVVVVPKSIVYHIGEQTIKKIKPKVAFHGFKNQIIMKLTNFETHLVLKKLIQFFILYGSREFKIWLDYTLFKKTNLTPTKYETKIAQKPSLQIILKSIFWIILNINYVLKKHKTVNKLRILSTKTLEQKKVLSNITQ